MPLSFFKDKSILVTGHTGFKGTWLCNMLANAGANVTGFALAPDTEQNLFDLSGVQSRIDHIIGDVRDMDALSAVFRQARPELVIHLAAQPLVLDSYQRPRYTYEVNVMGTVNVLECVRTANSVRSFLNVTTDKVYDNKEWHWGYRESEPLDGFDPYSNSKSCSELVTHSYKRSFFGGEGACAISTARAGNVIGGGDFAANRIIPDCVRAALDGRAIDVRNPHSTRPYQHVLEPLSAYLLILQRQYENPALAGYYNVGPDDCDCITTGQLVDIFCNAWGEDCTWRDTSRADAPHEAAFLKLDSSLIKNTLGWQPRWHADEAVRRTVEWTRDWRGGEDIAAVMARQTEEFYGKVLLTNA